MLLVEMPKAHRPPDTLTLAKRQDAIIDWASDDKALLSSLDFQLKSLIKKQGATE